MRLEILGTNHFHQAVGNRKGRPDAFQSYLVGLARSNKYDAIAEELSVEAIPKLGGTDSVARLVSQDIGIKHLFCDPTSSERVEIGIRSEDTIKQLLQIGKLMNANESREVDAELKRDWPAREEFWLRKLRTLRASNILFIVGSDHVKTFSELLDRQRICFICLEERWSQELLLDTGQA